MRLKLTRRHELKLKTSTRLPAQFVGGTGMTVTRANGVYTIDMNVDEVASVMEPAILEMVTEAVDDALGAGVVESIDGHTGALDIGNGLAFTGDTLAVDVDGTTVVFDGSKISATDSIMYTPAGTGASQRTVQSRLQDRISVMDFIPAAEHAAIFDGTTTYNATADIQAAVDYADGAEVHFPSGTFRVSEIKRLTSVTDGFRTGMKLVGQGRSTNIVGITNNKAVLLWDVGYTPDGTATPTLKFTRDSEVRDMLITQAGGVTGTDGIKLTAAWHVKLFNVQVEGMSGKGIHVPFRSDIYAAVSDNWQCFSFDIQHCRFSECTDWGVYFGGGQSPGLWRMQYSIIANNAGGGIYTSTGQFVFTDNLITSNGTFGGNGGMLIEGGIEGQSFNATIERNEFDTCHSYFLWMLDCRNTRVVGNRFLSFTFASDTSLVFQSGSAFMRPVNQVKVGDGSTGGGATLTWNCLFEQNYHRSIYGAGPTTPACYGYISMGGDQVVRNRFINNDMHGRDGVTQNSSGFVRYSNLNVTDGNMMVDDGLVQVVAQASGATAVAGTDTTVAFATETVDNHAAWGSGTTFTTPIGGLYSVNVSVTLTGLADTNLATMKIKVGGVTVAQTERQASGTGDLTLNISTTLLLADTDSVVVTALQNSGSSKNTVTGAPTRLTITQVG